MPTPLSERIPNDEALKSLLEKNVPEIVAMLKERHGELEVSFNDARKKQRVVAYSLILLFGILPGALLASGVLPDLISSMIAVPFIFGIFSYYFFTMDARKTIKEFNRKINNVLFPIAFKILDIEGEIPHIPDSDLLSSIRHSELLTVPHNRNFIGDKFLLRINNRRTEVSEIILRHVTGSGKSRRDKLLFHGYFVMMSLERTLQGKTFISKEGDKYGFGKRNFFSQGEARETILEWNDFEELIHVATTNESEARYVLSTDFMESVHDWMKTKDERIRVAFHGKTMFMLFPDKKVRIDATIESFKEKEVREYLFTVMSPLVHVLHLAEKVKI